MKSTGAVPKWTARLGPGRKVMYFLRGKGIRNNVTPWLLASQHIEGVWGLCYATSARAGAAPDPLEFSAKVSRHVVECRYCQTKEAMDVWNHVMPYMQVMDVLKAFREEERNP